MKPSSPKGQNPGIKASVKPSLAQSIFWTFKDLFTLERHGARTLHGLRARISQRLLALTAGIALNHQLDRPTRSLITYYA